MIFQKYSIQIATIVGIILILSSFCLNSENTTQIEPLQYPPLLIREFEEDFGVPTKDQKNLISIKESQGFTVSIKEPKDLNKIRSTGVFITTEEPTYVVIFGDERRINALKFHGFDLREIKESDHKIRSIKIWVKDKDQLKQFIPFLSDFFPVLELPNYIYGGAYDYQIERLRQRGYQFEFVSN